jgi:outer membrane biosynthesis protein TonB
VKRTFFCVALILCMAIMAGCAAQASGKTQTPISAKAELTSAQKADDTAEVATALLPSQTVEENSKTEDSADAPLPVERANASENADNAAEKQPTAVETAPPTVPEELVTPAPVPEDKPAPAPAPTPAPTQKPAEKQEEEPVPEPVPAPELKPEPADRWAAVEAANAYAAAQYGVITDGSLTLDNSAYRFPASVAADASQEVLEAKARDMVDYTFRQLMMQAGMDSIADAGFHCNVCIVEDGASLLIYVLYDG